MKTIRSIILFALLLITYILLPLITWSIYDYRSFFNNPIRVIYCIIIITLSFIVCIRAYYISVNPLVNQGKADRLNKLQKITYLLNRLLVISILLLSPYFDKKSMFTLPDYDIIRLAGLILFIFGMFLTLWCHIYLGKQHSVDVTIQENHNLITNGPYKLIRNPMYSGIIASSIGLALIFLSILGLLINMLIIILFIWRIIEEEKLLKSEFKDKWFEYFKKTWRLIPFIY